MATQFDGDVPIYLQIANQIREAILAGDIPEGEAIPSVRQIAVEYQLNPQTVMNATQQLLTEGLIEKRRGLGMFVADGARKQLMTAERERFKSEELPAAVSKAKLLGLSREELEQILKERYEEGKE